MGLGTLLVRADATAEIGTGHVMRCLALAQAWQDAGGQAVFAMSRTISAMQARLTAEGYRVVALAGVPGSIEDSESTAGLARACGAEWVVIDGYHFAARYQERVRDAGSRLMCLDDNGDCEHFFADVVLNQNIHASEAWYRSREGHTQLLLGTQYSMLRKEFGQWRGWERDIPTTGGGRVLVTLGGCPPEALVVRVLEGLALVPERCVAKVVVVSGSIEPDRLKQTSPNLARKIVAHNSVSNMAELIAYSDVAISAAGSTCWELCFMGLPSLLIDVASNQTPVALELERRGCALYLGDAKSVSTQKIAGEMEPLLNSREIRQCLSNRSRQLVDGYGAERVVAALCGAAVVYS